MQIRFPHIQGCVCVCVGVGGGRGCKKTIICSAIHVFFIYKHNAYKHTEAEICFNIFDYLQKYWLWEIFDYVRRKFSSWNLILSSLLGVRSMQFEK